MQETAGSVEMERELTSFTRFNCNLANIFWWLMQELTLSKTAVGELAKTQTRGPWYVISYCRLTRVQNSSSACCTYQLMIAQSIRGYTYRIQNQTEKNVLCRYKGKEEETKRGDCSVLYFWASFFVDGYSSFFFLRKWWNTRNFSRILQSCEKQGRGVACYCTWFPFFVCDISTAPARCLQVQTARSQAWL